MPPKMCVILIRYQRWRRWWTKKPFTTSSNHDLRWWVKQCWEHLQATERSRFNARHCDLLLKPFSIRSHKMNFNLIYTWIECLAVSSWWWLLRCLVVRFSFSIGAGNAIAVFVCCTRASSAYMILTANIKYNQFCASAGCRATFYAK